MNPTENIVIFDNIKYQKIPGTTCTGCAFEKLDYDNYCAKQDSVCIDENILYMKVIPPALKYTVEEVLRAYFGYSLKEVTNGYLQDIINSISKKLLEQSDPDYLQYLKLKDKYANKD